MMNTNRNEKNFVLEDFAYNFISIISHNALNEYSLQSGVDITFTGFYSIVIVSLFGLSPCARCFSYAIAFMHGWRCPNKNISWILFNIYGFTFTHISAD